MGSFLQKVILDNTVQDYLISFSAILFILYFKRYLSRFIAGLFFRLFKRSSMGGKKEPFVLLLKGPIHVFLILMVTYLALEHLRFPSAFRFTVFHVSSRQIVESTASAILIVAFIWLLLRLIDFISMMLEHKASMTPGFSNNQLIVFFKDFLKVIFIFIGLLLLIRFSFQRDIAALLAGFGIVGAALALAARESLENLIASFIIFFDKPFSHGDLVKIQAFTGTVERIGLRSTRIRTDQKTYVTVPNKQMVDSILDNLSLRTQRRSFLALEISSSTPSDLVSQMIKGIENIISEKKEQVQNFSVVLADINKTSFIIQVEMFTGAVAMDIFNVIRQDIHLSVIRLMEELDIKLAGKDSEIILMDKKMEEKKISDA
jgi:MscS family membrane protein